MSKPFLIIQLRPEDATADNELDAIKHYGALEDSEIIRLRAEQASLKDIELSGYAGIIVGGSPFDISTPADQKSATQLEIEAVGRATVALSEEGKRDPLLKGFPDTFRVLLGHK